MNPVTLSMRFNARLYIAKLEIREERVSLRCTAQRFHIPKSALHEQIRRDRITFKAERRRALTESEEKTIVYSLLYLADRGSPLTRTHAQEAVEIFVERLPKERKDRLPFTNG